MRFSRASIHGSPTSRLARDRAKRRWFLTLLWLFAGLSIQAQSPVQEEQVKATLLFNFCHFVQWPDSAFTDPAAPFIIGILGHDPFGKFLDDLVNQETAHGRPITIRRFSRVEEITQSHLLYVSASEQTKIRSIAAALRGRPLLSVGESVEPGFIRNGGMIEFTKERGNIKLRINLDEARAAGLSIGSKLLKVAQVQQTQK